MNGLATPGEAQVVAAASITAGAAVRLVAVHVDAEHFPGPRAPAGREIWLRRVHRAWHCHAGLALLGPDSFHEISVDAHLGILPRPDVGDLPQRATEQARS